jgi:hypothetical protein
MRKGKSIPFIFAAVIGIFFTSTSPYIPSYGGKILFINNSSYNLLLEFTGRYSAYNSAYNIESKIYIEKEEQLSINHVFFHQGPSNPNNLFKQVKIYDADTGDLLKELRITDVLFTLDSGSAGSCTAEFSLRINKSLF